MAQDTALQVIELQQLPIIVERLHSVKADIERRTAEATSLICTEETYKSVKDARAQLTKEFKEYEAKRTAIKSKILEPYNAFEQVYRRNHGAPDMVLLLKGGQHRTCARAPEPHRVCRV